MPQLKCTKCGKLGAIPYPSIKSVWCDHCQAYTTGLGPIPLNREAAISKTKLVALNKTITELSILMEEQTKLTKTLTNLIESLK